MGIMNRIREFARPTPVDLVAERKAAIHQRHEMAMLDLVEKQADLIEEWGRKSIDYEMQFNTAFRPSLNTDRAKGAASPQALLGQITACRELVAFNPFAKSAISNIQHYVLGENGMSFRVTGDASRKNSQKVAEKTAFLWDKWVEREGFIHAQSECIQRILRDCSVLLRWFTGTKGDLKFRFIEPEQLKAEGRGDSQNPGNQWGIELDPKDPVTRLGYWVKYDLNKNDQSVKAELIDVAEFDYLPSWAEDRNVIRPTPILYGSLPHLEGASGVIRNMRELVRVQTAIAIIREHPEGMSGSMIAAWATARAHASPTDTDTDATVLQEKMQPGTIMDVQNGEKIHFPAAQMQVDRMVSAIQADLRAVAASIGLPEFIFSADASSSNYASLLAAEGPAVKTFEYLQGYMGRFFRKAFERFLMQAVTSGIRYVDLAGKEVREKLPSSALKLNTSVIGPSVRTGKMFEEARVSSIEAKAGILSPQQWCATRNRDYDQTQRQIEEHNAAFPDRPWPPQDPGKVQDTQDADDEKDAKGTSSSTDDKTGSEKRNAGDAE